MINTDLSTTCGNTATCNDITFVTIVSCFVLEPDWASTYWRGLQFFVYWLRFEAFRSLILTQQRIGPFSYRVKQNEKHFTFLTTEKCRTWVTFPWELTKMLIEKALLPLNPLTWKIWWAPNNASRWQMGFNSAFKGLKELIVYKVLPVWQE